MDIKDITVNGFDSNEYKNKDNELPVGTVLREKYVIGRELGSGNFGITYLGYDLENDRTVAVKEFYLFRYVSRDEKGTNAIISINSKNESIIANRKEKFKQEAEIASSIAHTQISVPVYEYFEENQTAYIVMEYIPGKTLDKYISEKGKLSISETADIIMPLAKSLKTIHEMNVIHRDIKPDNIIIDTNGYPRLLDFGSAKEYTSESDGKTLLVFTENYAAMEQRSIFLPKGPWTDVYGLCAVMYSCLAGEVPVSSEDRSYLDDPDKELLLKLRQVIGDGNAELCDVIVKGMALDAEDRYQNMQELTDDLSPCLYSESEIKKLLRKLKKKGISLYKKSIKNIRKLDKKKAVIITLSAIAVIVSVYLAIVAYINSKVKNDINALGDGQIVYLKADEEKSDEEVSAAFDSIKTRLDVLCKKEGYTLNIEGREAELYVPYTVFGKCDSIKTLKHFLLNSAKIYLVYDYYNNMELVPEDVESFNREGDTIRIELSDSASNQVKNQVEKWNRLETRYDGRELVVSNIDDISDFGEYSSFSKDDSQLYLYLDYDFILDRDADNSVAKCLANVSSDGKIITLSESEEYEKSFGGIAIKDIVSGSNVLDLLRHDACNSHFNNVFDISYNASVVWERNKKKIDKRAIWGENQKSPEYFIENNIEAVDVVYRRVNSDEQYDGDIDNLWFENRNALAKMLDDVDMMYAIGCSPDGTESVIIRLPIMNTGDCYFELLGDGIDNYLLGGIGLYDEAAKDSYSSFEDNVILYGEFADGFRFDNGKLVVALKSENELMENPYYEIIHSESSSSSLNDGAELIYRLNDDDNNYLTGTYDKIHHRVIFDKSTFGENGEIDNVVESYFTLFNLQLDNIAQGNELSSGYYKYAEAIPYNHSRSKAFGTINYGLVNRLRKTKESILSEALANKLGSQPEVSIPYGNICEIKLVQGVGDNYADNLTDLLNTTMDVCINKQEEFLESDNPTFVFYIMGFDGIRRTSIVVRTGDTKVIDVRYEDDFANNENMELLHNQLLNLKSNLQNLEQYSDYEVNLQQIYR